MNQKLKRQYTLGILLAVMLLVVNQVFVQYWLFKKDEDAQTINLSGRQRTLSQQISLEFERFADGQTNLDCLHNLFQKWGEVHYGLLEGNPDLGIHKLSDLTALHNLEQISANVLFVEDFLKNPSITESSRWQLYENQIEFLAGMEIVVKSLERNSDEKLHFIVIMEIILALLSMIVLVMEVRYIYRPISQSLINHIKKLKETQYKFQAVFNSTTDYNIILDRSFSIVAFNNVARKIVKVIFNEDLEVGQSVFDYSMDGYRDTFHQDLNKALEGDIVKQEIEVPIPNSTSIWMDVTHSPIYDQRNEIIGVSFNTTNIDKRKRASLKLQEQNEKLRKIAWRQSHEVRRPVATIAGLCILLRERDDNYLHYLDCLETAVNELDNVIRTIVDETV